MSFVIGVARFFCECLLQSICVAIIQRSHAPSDLQHPRDTPQHLCGHYTVITRTQRPTTPMWHSPTSVWPLYSDHTHPATYNTHVTLPNICVAIIQRSHAPSDLQHPRDTPQHLCGHYTAITRTQRPTTPMWHSPTSVWPLYSDHTHPATYNTHVTLPNICVAIIQRSHAPSDLQHPRDTPQHLCGHYTAITRTQRPTTPTWHSPSSVWPLYSDHTHPATYNTHVTLPNICVTIIQRSHAPSDLQHPRDTPHHLCGHYTAITRTQRPTTPTWHSPTSVWPLYSDHTHPATYNTHVTLPNICVAIIQRSHAPSDLQHPRDTPQHLSGHYTVITRTQRPTTSTWHSSPHPTLCS